MKFSKEDIDDLFKNKYFLESLHKYIVDNIKIRQDYDLYTGKYDEPTIYFGDELINIESKNYGI